MAAFMTLDDKDRKLLALLRADGRMRNRELAQRVGLSPSACLTRVRRLEETGVIAGYRAVVAAYGRGGVEGWIDVRVSDPSHESAAALADLIEATDEVTEAHKATGASDYVLRFCASDMTALNAFKGRLEALGCHAHARLSFLLNSLK